MIKTDESALICDFAETYHIYDYRSLPLHLAVTFACGLRDNSRIKLKLANIDAPIDLGLQALMVDYLALLLWSKTKDGVKGRNKPASIYDRLFNKEENNNDDIVGFDSGEDFERALASLRKG